MKYIHYITVFSLLTVLFSMVNPAKATSLITVTDGYIKASIPGSGVTAAYMTIKNSTDKEITLLKISSTISDRIEIHRHSMVDGMMRMREVANVTIAANSEVVLQPMGLHLMIFALKRRITEEEVIPVTLHLSNNTEINIQLPVYRYK